MNIQQLTDWAREQGQRRRENPEGYTVRVLTRSQDDAEALAADVARRLYPRRRFGRVLYAEQDEPTSWLVTVEDCGPVPQGKAW